MAEWFVFRGDDRVYVVEVVKTCLMTQMYRQRLKILYAENEIKICRT